MCCGGDHSFWIQILAHMQLNHSCVYTTCLHSHLFGYVADSGTVCISIPLADLRSACKQFAPLLSQMGLVSRGPDTVPLQQE